MLCGHVRGSPAWRTWHLGGGLLLSVSADCTLRDVWDACSSSAPADARMVRVMAPHGVGGEPGHDSLRQCGVVERACAFSIPRSARSASAGAPRPPPPPRAPDRIVRGARWRCHRRALPQSGSAFAAIRGGPLPPRRGARGGGGGSWLRSTSSRLQHGRGLAPRSWRRCGRLRGRREGPRARRAADPTARAAVRRRAGSGALWRAAQLGEGPGQRQHARGLPITRARRVPSARGFSDT